MFMNECSLLYAKIIVYVNNSYSTTIIESNLYEKKVAGIRYKVKDTGARRKGEGTDIR